MTYALHQYQRDAVSFLRAHDRAGLFMEMGLGKTATVLSALKARHLPVLVVAPKRVAETVWPEEGAIWRPDLKVVRAIGTMKKRQEALEDRTADVIVIGRDNVADALPFARCFNTLVLDELSGFKNRKTNRWKAAARLAWANPKLGVPEIPVVWGLTGTPSPNGLMDLWAEIFLLDGGDRLEDTLTKYRTRYFYPERVLPTGIVAKWGLREGSAPRIHAALETRCLSMSAEKLLKDLPAMTFNRVSVPLPPKAQRLYSAMANEFVVTILEPVDKLAKLNAAAVRNEALREAGVDLHTRINAVAAEYYEDGDKVKTFTAASAAVVYNKLAQITAGFLYQQDEHGERIPNAVERIHDAKLNALEEIVDGTGSPVLVFYRYQAEKDAILKRLKDQAHTLDEPDAVNRWNAGELPVVLAHPASAGHGLNLQKGPGHTAVWTTLPWSLEEWSQANRRLARQGQAAPVIVHTLEAPESVDGYVFDVLTGKASTERALMDHLERG